MSVVSLVAMTLSYCQDNHLRLSDDILVSHSASALMRGRSVDHMYEEPGTVAVWRWLGLDRFLPEGKLRLNMTGCPSVCCSSFCNWLISETDHIPRIGEIAVRGLFDKPVSYYDPHYSRRIFQASFRLLHALCDAEHTCFNATFPHTGSSHARS